MRLRILVVVSAVMMWFISAQAQQSHWAPADDATAKYIVDMERKWTEGVCANNGVIAKLLADDFQGTSVSGARFTKADELRTARAVLMIVGWMKPKCASLETRLPSSMAANMRSAKTNLSRTRRFARRGPIPG